jgi:5,10-methylenetetrahydromethanopterin reductase
LIELSCCLLPGPDFVAHARLAESLGYRRVWVGDSPALYTDVWVAIARIAAATERIGVGPAVLIPSLRHVLVNASAIAGIEALAPGRLAVAVGTGFTGRYMLGKKPLPWKRVERYVSDLRALLRGEEIEVDGALVRMCHPGGYAPPRPLTTPILVAANGPKGLAVARALGDGVMCAAAPQPGFDWCSLLVFGTVLDADEDARTPRVFEAAGPGIAVVYHGTYEAAGAAVDNLPGGAAWRAEIEKIPVPLRHLAVHEGHMVEVGERDRRHVSPNLLGATFSGTREQLRERMAGLEAGGLSELIYAPAGPDIARELRAMADVVAAVAG